MRGEWNELQALFLKDCPYAYYMLSFLIKTSALKIFEVKYMMGLVTCMVNGMDYKLFFLKIAHMLIMYIVWLIGCN